ncbi:GNAT family N-acetyltransferase [Yoonia sp. R2331]|uniref:GNAT family N-acetyltransferase n=1 Tax=Yoonia sp. R2331 TaxID=3237238 RepID=UPI0034E40171
MFDMPLPTHARTLPLQQSPAYARTLRALGQKARIVHGDGVGQMAVVTRQTPFGPLRAAMRGPLWETPDPRDRVDFLRRHRVHLHNPEDDAPDTMRAAGFWQVMTPGTVGLMDLTRDPVAAMHGKWRNAWRSAARADLRVQSGPFEPARDNWILALDGAQQRVRGFRGYPHAFTHAFAAQNPDAALCYVAYQERSQIAAMIFLLHAPTATYHIGWTGEDGRRCNAHRLLLIQAARDLSARGMTTLDLGQIDTRRAPGLARFKLGAGAQPVTLGGTWVRLPWCR